MSLDLQPWRDSNGHVHVDYFAERQRRASEEASVGGEVRMVANLGTNAARTVYLESVAEQRGKRAALDLRRMVWGYMQANGIRFDEPEQVDLF